MSEEIEQSRYHHGDLRGALIAAGRAILEEAGPHGLSLREAARRANVSHAAPRHHFPSLRHFLGDCAADGFDEFDAALRVGAARGADPVAALAEMGRAYVCFAVANRAMFRLMFDRDSFTEPTAALVDSGGRAYATLVSAVAAVSDGADAGEIDYRTASVWSLAHGYAHLTLEGRIGFCGAPQAPPEELAARAVRAYLAGALGP